MLERSSQVKKPKDRGSYMTTKESYISLIGTMNLMNSQWMQLDMEMCLILGIIIVTQISKCSMFSLITSVLVFPE